MNFIGTVSCIFLVSLLLNTNSCFQPAGILTGELERLLEELTNLKSQLSQWFRTNNIKNCSRNAEDDQEYLGIIYNYLHDNQTGVTEHQHKATKRNNTLSTFLDDLKGKIYKIIHRNPNSTESSKHIRRCISKSVKIHKNNPKSAGEVESFHQYLNKVVKCLEANRKSSNTENNDDMRLGVTMSEETTTEVPSEDNRDVTSGIKVENFLKFMANAKHTVEETGRAGFRPPDLQKTQEIIDSVKNSMVNFNLDDDEDESTTTTTIDPFSFNDIRKRNIFDNFMKKFESKSQKEKTEISSSAKIKSYELFDGLPRIDEIYSEISSDDERKEIQVDEGTLLDNDLNALDSKLDSQQRMVSGLG